MTTALTWAGTREDLGPAAVSNVVLEVYGNELEMSFLAPSQS